MLKIEASIELDSPTENKSTGYNERISNRLDAVFVKEMKEQKILTPLVVNVSSRDSKGNKVDYSELRTTLYVLEKRDYELIEMALSCYLKNELTPNRIEYELLYQNIKSLTK